MQLHRGEIWLVELGNGIGSEQNGRQRPVLVVQNDIGNFHSPTVTIIPLTSQLKKCLPTHVTLQKTNCLLYTSTALIEQIATISKERFIKFIGVIDKSEMFAVENALLIQIGITPRNNCAYA